MTEKTIADVLEFAPRAEELATRLVAAGPKAAHVSASETHEIADFVHMAILALRRQSPEASVPVADERAAFEAEFPVPLHCEWIGNGYAVTEYNAWDASRHKSRWEGWKARAALASAPVAGEARPVAVTDHQGNVHWRHGRKAGIALYAAPQARPSDDELWDQTLAERDEYHDMADKLADAIADHLLVEIGEHSSSNCPWMRALDAIQNAVPQASTVAREGKPSDAEIMAIVREQCPDFDDAHEGPDQDDMIRTARALLSRYAAPQASEAARDASDMDDLRSRVLAAIHDCAALTPEDDESWDEWYCAAFDLLGSRVGEIFRVALSAQPADKPATPRAAPAPMPRQQCVCRLAETGNAHTDGGAVYE